MVSVSSSVSISSSIAVSSSVSVFSKVGAKVDTAVAVGLVLSFLDSKVVLLLFSADVFVYSITEKIKRKKFTSLHKKNKIPLAMSFVFVL